MKKGLFSGSFDPPTLGHIELIKRMATLCDQLVVGIGENFSKKQPVLTAEEKLSVLKKETQTIPNIEIALFTGLATEFAKAIKATVLFRGLRSPHDFEAEKQMSSANRKLTDIETLFLIADEGTSHISSSLIRELAANGAPLHDFIPEGLEQLLHTRLQGKK